MKVLFTIDTLTGGGTEKSILDLINHFNKDLDVSVCYFYNKHELREAFLKAPCSLIYLSLGKKYSFIKGVYKLVNLIKKNKYDLVVTSLYRASIISRIACLITKTPLVDTFVNDSYGQAKKKEFEGLNILKFYLVFTLDRLTSGIPMHWISNAKYIADTLSKQLNISSSKISIISRGRDVHIMDKWQHNNTRRYFHFVSIGRLFPQKGHADLIRAFHVFHKIHNESKLTIYGEGPLRDHLSNLIQELKLENSVSLPGHIINGWKNLYDADCFVLSSHYEGFSGALIEALVLGIPVICSDIPMNKEAVSHSYNGILYKVGDIQDLINSLEHIYNHFQDAIKRGEIARAEAVNKYDIQTIANQYEKVLSELLNSNAEKYV